MEPELNVVRMRNVVPLVILSRTKPAKWQPETLLCRVVTRRGAELLVMCTGEAVAAMRSMRLKMAYKVDIVGKCLKETK